VFTPLIPSTAVGTLEFRAIQEPVRTLPSVSQYYQAKAREIDFDKKIITCRGIFDNEIFTLNYDKLVLAQGVKTNTFNTPNLAEREGNEVFFLKNLHHARGIRNRTIEMFEIAALPETTDEERRRLLSFIIVGGGPTSCEYASELHDFLSHDLIRLYPDLSKYVKITLIEAGPALLGPFEASLREYVESLFTKRDIEVLTGTAVTAVETFTRSTYKHEATKAVLSDGKELEFGTMIWSAGLQAVKITAKLDVEKNQGRIVTDEFCRVKGHEGSVWAIGDCATIDGAPLPQLAQVAQQQGKYLAPILAGDTDEETQPFHFFQLGSMASIGGGKAIMDLSHVGDPYGLNAMFPSIKGFAAWIAWRSAYWGKQVSLANKVLIPMYWFKSWAFGRDISRF